MKKKLSKTRYVLYLVKHEPEGWMEDIENLAEEEYKTNSELRHWLEKRKEEDAHKKTFLQWRDKILPADFKSIRLRPFTEELTLGQLYFHYAYQKHFETMSEQEQEWWLERNYANLRQFVKERTGLDIAKNKPN